MIQNLYHAQIIALSRRARDRQRLVGPDLSARVDNPLCGDRVIIDLALAAHKITAVGHHVRGCALCEAAAEILAEAAVGLTLTDVLTVETETRIYLKSRASDILAWPQLSVFDPARDVPSRHQCVLLPFAAVRKATDLPGSGHG